MCASIINPISTADGLIRYGETGLNVQRIFAISSADFLKMHEDLLCRGLKVRCPNAGAQIDFVLYCHSLTVSGAEVDILISEFNTAQLGDGTDMKHALSLAKLYFHYFTAGHRIQVIRTDNSQSTADLCIDGVKCDLKVRHDQTEKRMEPHGNLLSEGKSDEYYDIFWEEIRSMEHDLSTAIRNRVQSGFVQADCIILDLSNHFHSWNYHRLLSLQKAGEINGLSADPVAAIAGACILFSPNNARDLRRTGFHPEAFWGYLPLVTGNAR